MDSFKPILIKGYPVGIMFEILQEDDGIKRKTANIAYKDEKWYGSYKQQWSDTKEVYRSETMPLNVMENIIYMYNLEKIAPEYLNKMRLDFA